jgi:hypothetical protein
MHGPCARMTRTNREKVPNFFIFSAPVTTARGCRRLPGRHAHTCGCARVVVVGCPPCTCGPCCLCTRALPLGVPRSLASHHAGRVTAAPSGGDTSAPGARLSLSHVRWCARWRHWRGCSSAVVVAVAVVKLVVALPGGVCASGTRHHTHARWCDSRRCGRALHAVGTRTALQGVAHVERGACGRTRGLPQRGAWRTRRPASVVCVMRAVCSTAQLQTPRPWPLSETVRTCCSNACTSWAGRLEGSGWHNTVQTGLGMRCWANTPPTPANPVGPARLAPTPPGCGTGGHALSQPGGPDPVGSGGRGLWQYHPQWCWANTCLLLSQWARHWHRWRRWPKHEATRSCCGAGGGHKKACHVRPVLLVKAGWPNTACVWVVPAPQLAQPSWSNWCSRLGGRTHAD